MMTQTEPKPTSTNPWLETWRVDRLKQLAAQGLSASRIAEQIEGVSRNAVIGKLHRLGLSNGVKAAAPKPRRPRRRRGPPNLKLQGAPVFMPRGPIVEVKMDDGEPSYRYSPPEKQQVTIVELKNHHCRWPLGDPRNADMTDRTKFAFCGGDAVAGLPYCGGHARMAYRAPPRR